MPHDSIPSPVDLDFRPASYTDFGDPVAVALNGISGQMRREMVRDMLTSVGAERTVQDALLGPIEPDILEERASEAFRSTMSYLGGPTWMGGEYLPPLLPQEVEIARIILRSSTMDVSAVRARWSGGRYHYRMVDEYDTDLELDQKTSRRPLTLGRLIELLESAEAVTQWWEQQWGYGDPPSECTAFATVESEIYPGLAVWYAARAAAWEALREAEDPGRTR
ncbi:MAG: hypothetical protein EA351_00710 [Gemmatimonadales bacterium]|nr:MAG: hypothetical protein EA351_00710 [Gemmatimonadales bacterium]